MPAVGTHAQLDGPAVPVVVRAAYVSPDERGCQPSTPKKLRKFEQNIQYR